MLIQTLKLKGKEMQSYRELFELIDKMEFDDGDFELPSFFSMPAPPPPIYQKVDQPVARQNFPTPPNDRTFPLLPEESEQQDDSAVNEKEPVEAAPHPYDNYTEPKIDAPQPMHKLQVLKPPSPYKQAWDDDMTALDQAKEPVAVAEPFVPTPVAVYQPDDWDDNDDTNHEPETALPEFDESQWTPHEPAEEITVADYNPPPYESKVVPPKRKRNALSWIANAMVVLVFITIIGSALLFIFANDADMSIGGYRLFHVVSDSMAPVPQPDGEILPGGFRANDAIIVRVADAHQVEVGDIVTISRGEGEAPLTHRVTHVLDNFYDETGIGFLTRGDSNTYSDPPAGGSQLLGIKVTSIPRVGHLFTFAQNNTAMVIGICIILISSVFVLFIFSLRKAAAELEKHQIQPHQIEGPPSTSDFWEPPPNEPQNATPQGDWTAQPAFANRR